MKYDMESIRLRPASNGFILEYCELSEKEGGGGDSCCGDYYKRDYRTEVYKYSEFKKAADRMVSLVKTIVPSKMMEEEKTEMMEE